jgi:hypothetical protein
MELTTHFWLSKRQPFEKAFNLEVGLHTLQFDRGRFRFRLVARGHQCAAKDDTGVAILLIDA